MGSFFFGVVLLAALTEMPFIGVIDTSFSTSRDTRISFICGSILGNLANHISKCHAELKSFQMYISLLLLNCFASISPLV
jgi:hypothetical protein